MSIYMYHVVGNHMSLLNYREGGVNIFKKSSTNFTESRTDRPREAIGPLIEGGGGSVPVFLREYLATCGFPDDGGGHPAPHSCIIDDFMQL